MASLSSASPPSTDALAQKIINLENEIEGYKQELVELKAELQTAQEAEPRDEKKIEEIKNDIKSNKDAIKVMHIRLTGLEADQRQAAAHAQPDQVQVPDEEPFARDVSECVNLELGKSSCPAKNLVGLDDGVIEESLEIVKEGLCDETSSTHRVAPLVITRLARGGKTTALVKIFDAIKKKKRPLNEEKVNVMIISFNGHGTFERVKGETQADSIIRNIVRQLVPEVNQKKIRCAAEELDKYIGDKPFVLLIDELNKIRNPVGGDNAQSRNPVDQDAKRLLQQLFLGKKNRYLVFTSHYRINIDPLAADDMVSESDPGVKSISLPVSTDLETLRKMPGCGSINAATVALYGGIPSLIFSVRGLNSKTPQERFVDAGVEILEADQPLVLRRFVKAVITGERNTNMTMLDQFAITNYEKIQWPICYIQCILGLFEKTEIIQFILDGCNDLVSLASKTGTGLDWECVVHIALGFRCLYQQFYGSESPFGIIPLAVKPIVIALALPDDVQSIKTAKAHISKLTETSCPALVLATPTFSSFPIVDGLVAFCSTPEEIVIYGYQAKLGEGLPKNDFNKKQGLDRGILLQGAAPDKDKLFKGWEHWNKEQVQQLLGYSLKDLYPADWSSFNYLPAAAAAEDAAAAEETVPGKNKKIKQTK